MCVCVWQVMTTRSRRVDDGVLLRCHYCTCERGTLLTKFRDPALVPAARAAAAFLADNRFAEYRDAMVGLRAWLKFEFRLVKSRMRFLIDW